ncbi:MAG: hypothetical protein KJ065_22615 [Anaerolineae bacterium]|nr:hypothetical protein [Anaerolineae bacterium]
MNGGRFWDTTSGECVIWIVAVVAALALTAILTVNLGALEAGLIFSALLLAIILVLARALHMQTF